MNTSVKTRKAPAHSARTATRSTGPAHRAAPAPSIQLSRALSGRTGNRTPAHAAAPAYRATAAHRRAEPGASFHRPAPGSRRAALEVQAAAPHPLRARRTRASHRAVPARTVSTTTVFRGSVAAALAFSGLVFASVSAPSDSGVEHTAHTAALSAPVRAVSSDADVPARFDREGLTSTRAPKIKAQATKPVPKPAQTAAPAPAPEAAGAGPAAAVNVLMDPLSDATRSSPFGLRTSPITGDAAELHTGQDYAAQCTADVSAAAPGTVISAGWHPYGGGQRVEVDHGNGLVTTYNHLMSFHVVTGQKVQGGDSIASVGSTGASTGCHLHFEVVRDGEHVDPAGWL